MNLLHWMCRTAGQLTVVSFLLSAAFPAFADPSLFGPSVVAFGERVTFQGVNFKPRAFINVIVTDPRGGEQAYPMVVSDSGAMSHDMTINSGGRYQLRAVNELGTTIATATLVVGE